MGEVLLIKAGVQLFQASDTVSKVNETVASLQVFDTDGNLELDEAEIKGAIEILKTNMENNPDKAQAAQLSELRCMLVFIGASQRMWESDPEKYDAQFSQACRCYLVFYH